MKGFQKVIKYVAIAFGLYLTVLIIGAIVTGVLAITTGIYGVSIINEQVKVELVDKKDVFEQFSKMDLEINASNIEIKAEGDEYKVETYQVPATTEIKIDNGKLEIKDSKKITMSNESKITIYVPEDTVLEELELEMGAGSVNIKNIISSNAKIECGAGQVIFEEADLTNADIDAGVGKLVYSGYMKGNSKINCGIGEVNLNLVGGNEMYSIDADKGIGDIKINGDKIANETIIGNGENKISVEGGIGSINIQI